MRPKISVIVPVFNSSIYLPKCLNSVLSQTYNNWEVIALDDGSIDDSFSILQKYSEIDKRIISATKQNEGPGLTRNKALDMASGDIVIFLDSDDYLDPFCFELIIDRAVNHNEEVVFIDATQETPEGKKICIERMSKFKQWEKNDILKAQMTGYMPWGGWRKAAKRSIIEEHKLRYSEMPVGEEAIFSFDLIRFSKKIGFIDKSLYHYVNHPGSQSKTPNATWQTTLDKMKNHLNSNNLAIEFKDGLNGLAFSVLISWLLRNAKSMSSRQCFSEFKCKVATYRKDFGFEFNPAYMRKELRMLLPFVKKGFLWPIVVAAKYY